MASKQKRGAPEEEATGSSLKRRCTVGVEGPSKIRGREELGVVQGPSNEVNGEGYCVEVLDQVDEEEDLQDGNEHPLLNSLVLETVLQYTGTLEEVKRNRLVCRTWMNASEPQWTRLTKTLTLFRNEELPQEFDLPSDEVMMTLQQLNEMCDGARSALEKVVLYRKFKFLNWTFDADLVHTLNTINEPVTTDPWFWNRIAPSLIKSLTLENCWFPVRFMPFEECLLKTLPNLESISVIRCTSTHDILKAAVTVWMSEPEEDEVDQRASLNYKHPNLKHVHLNVPRQKDQYTQPASMLPFLGMVSSLEGFRIEGVDPVVAAICLRALVVQMVSHSLNHGLVKLNLLDFFSRTYGNRSSDIFDDVGRLDGIFLFDNLEELHFDLGYGPEAGQEIVHIQRNMPVLKKKLYLYRAPLSQPFSNFLEDRRIETLTELHLWGNLCSSLRFLNALPNLQVLKWVTSCYEEKFHGQRVMSALENSEELRIYPLMLQDLISASDMVNPLAHLTTFDLDCGPISATSWKRLGQWMPNLKNLKGILSRVQHLRIIREQWKQLETLELAHGSKLPGGKLLKELAKFGGSLRAFQWKRCACTKKLFGKQVVSGLQETEKKLGSQLPRICTFPWNANLDGDEVNVCRHAEFEETLMSKAMGSMEWPV